jgi:pyruvate/2-oxoglutarate dehydrogenase complex dihydrolipoamide dehydrogenase (E3) component
MAHGVTVDARLRTSNRKVFAVGDCAGGPAFTHIAGYHAGIVIRNALFRLPAKVNYQALPRVTYTDPELAVVGMSEAEARRAWPDCVVTRASFTENDRARAEGETAGHIKVFSRRNGRILGVALVGARAGELAAPWCLAIGRGLKLSALAGAVFPYPTLGELSKTVAGKFYAPKLFNPWTRKLVGFLLRLP